MNPEYRNRSDGVLLTGATGFIGMEILARYLERSDRPVYALVRGRDEEDASARLKETIEGLFGQRDAFAERVFAVPADIEQPGMGLTTDRREALAEHVRDIVHSAASVSFSLPIEESRQINVSGTERLLELGELCSSHGGLEHFSYISTAYVAGTHKGEFHEDQLDVGQRFRNPYEQSKFEAEKVVRARAARLPVQVFRPSIVVGERTTGWTASFNVLYSPLKAFVRGMLPALPAKRSAPVDVVPVDYVADAVYKLSNDPVDGTQTYHLVAGTRATSVGRLIDLSSDYVGRRRPVVIPPRLYEKLVYPVLSRGGSGQVRRGLERSRVFFPYFSMDVSYSNERARGRLDQAGIQVPPIESYFGRLLDYATRAGWGRAPLSRAEAAGTDDSVAGNGSRARSTVGAP